MGVMRSVYERISLWKQIVWQLGETSTVLINNVDKKGGKMEITLKQVSDGQAALLKIINQPMDIKLAYRVEKIANQLITEINNIDKSRRALIQKFGEEVKTGEKGKEIGTGTYRVKPENMDCFEKEYEKTLEGKVQTTIAKIPYECIVGIKISPAELIAVKVFIEEPKV